MEAISLTKDQTGAGAGRAGFSRFLLGFILPPLVACLLTGFAIAVLISNGERIGPVEAARLQQAAGGGLYGSSLVYRPYPYKLERYRLTDPDIAIIGSSRAMPFLAVGFNAPEINFGGAVNEIADGESLVPDMLALHRPKLVVFTLDYWWFNAKRVADPSQVSSSADIDLSLDDLIAPYRWLMDGSVTLPGLVRSLAGRSGPLRIGVLATQHDVGFDLEGAYHYGGALTGQTPGLDRKFKDTLKRLRNAHGASKLALHAEFSEAGWQSLLHTDRMLHDAGVEVRYIVPPVADTVYAQMKAAGPGLIAELHKRLADSGMAYYDFSDSAAVGSPDCEFVDGLHGGYVTYLRMLRIMAPDLEADAATRGLVKPVADLDRLIAANQGRATLHDEPAGREIDYLGLGCNKP